MTLTLHYQSYTAWKVSIIILHILAISLAIFRVWIQQRTRGLWWDDYLVAIPAIFDIFFCITLFVYPPIELSTITMRTAAFGNYWLSLFPSYAVVWPSRICFLVFLTRLFPPRHIYRRVTLSLAAIFAAIHFTLIGLTVPKCDGVHIFVPPTKKVCRMPPKINPEILFAFIIDLLSDIVLVACPLLMLYKVKLSRPGDKTIVLVSLGSSALTFVLVLAITIFNYGPFTKDVSYDIVIYMLAQMTAAVSLIACNMPIVACSVYRSIRRSIDKHADPPMEMPDASTVPVPTDADNQHHYTAAPQPPQAGGDSSGLKSTQGRLTYDNLTRISISQPAV